MVWKMTGKMIEACSCASACRCTLGPAEPDRGWCSGAFAFVVNSGQSEGVDLAGRKVLWLIDLPKDFASGGGTGRLYIDSEADASQRRELEAIFTGNKGGPGEVLGGLVTQWLPTETAPIDVSEGDNPTVTVKGIGHASLDPIRDGNGEPTTLQNAPVLGLIAIERAMLARSDGSRFAAAGMRDWESGGHGSVSPFSWAA